MILVIIVNLEAPTPNAALLMSYGTNLSASSVVFIIVGSIKIESEIPPAIPLNIDPNNTLVETIIAYINTPAIIEGIPASTFDQNLIIFNNLNYFTILDLPILVGISRKSFVQKKFNVSIENSLNASVQLNKTALENHASILRVHDVKETKIMLEEFIINSKE